MRLLVKGFLATACLAAAALYVGCAADSPTPTQHTIPPANGAGLNIQLSTTNATPVAGQCTLIEAFATFNGSAVPDGTSIVFSTSLGVFAQNSTNTVSLVTQSGAATAVLCAASQGTARVHATVSYRNATATATISIQFSSNGLPQCPLITQCAVPSSGPVTGGTPIVITGCGFGTDPTQVRVFFRHGSTIVPGTVTGVTDTTINAITPAFPGLDPTAATPVDLQVVLGAGFTLTSPSCFTFTGTTLQPVVNAILPSSGTKLGGTRVTIFGSGFSAPVQVTFGGGVGGGGALQVEVVSVTFNQIIAITPPAAANGTVTFPESVPVIVKNVACSPSSGATCQSDGTVTYTYTTPLQIYGNSPTTGEPGTAVTIYGQGFVAPVEVSMAGIAASVNSVTGTEILAVAPLFCTPTAKQGPIGVTNLPTGETNTGGSWTIVATAVTSGPSPSSGPGGVATTATVLGTGLLPASVSATGGTVTLVSSSTFASGTEELVLALTPDPCIKQESVSILNTATGCLASFTFGNSTPPTAVTISSPTATAPSGSSTYTFNATVSGGIAPYTYAWSFGDGGTSTSAPPVTYTYATPGTYTATLTVSDSCVPANTARATFTITAPAP